jgi:hypothetical protein
MKGENQDDEQTPFFGRSGCRRGSVADLLAGYGRNPGSDKGAQRRARSRALRRRLVLVRGDSAIAGGRPQRHLGAKPTDHLAGIRCLGSARSGPAERPNRLRRTFLLWNDPHRGRRAREGFGAGIRRGPGAGCRRGLFGIGQDFPDSPASAGIVFDGDEGRLTEAAFLRDFAGDLPEVKAKVLYAVQEPFHKALLTGKTTHAAWRSKPSYYAVSTEDRTINPDLERFMAKRMGAKTIEVKASHLSLISHPEEITRLILEATGQET